MAKMNRVPGIGALNRSAAVFWSLAAAIVFLAVASIQRPDGAASGTGADPFYGADAFTLLFEDFEGMTRAHTVSPCVIFAPGHISGQALFLTETGSHVLYAETWWPRPGEFVQTGTVEFYYRPETFISTPARSFAALFTTDERPQFPPGGGYPTLAVKEAGNLNWAVARSPSHYTQADYPLEAESPPLHPGQWYHIAGIWESGAIRLYLNGRLAANEEFDTFVLADEFQLGSRNTMAHGAMAARGRIDRFRLSSIARSARFFPSALDVRIDAPTSAPGGVPLERPFVVRARAYASDTRPRTLEIHADTDPLDFNGVLLASGLPDSGAFILGGGLADSTWYLYAIARAGPDVAYYYYPFPFALTPAGTHASIHDPIETTAIIMAPVDATESFALVLLNNGGSGAAPISRVTADGSGANHRITTRLLEAFDTAVISIWMREPVGGIMLGIRSDTPTLDTGNLPLGIARNDTGRRAFARTVIMTEFLRSDGSIIGDTKITSYIGETYAYTIEFRLSAQTTALFHAMGFDTSVGARGFAFYYADTYGCVWREDRGVTVSVVAGDAGGIRIRCAGITKDLPGGLGAPSPPGAVSIGVESPPFCLVEQLGVSGPLLVFLRGLRDWLLENVAGRALTAVYYGLSGG